MIDAVHGCISAVGAMMNIAMVGGFAFATALLWNKASTSFQAAGGIQPLSMSHAQALASDPALPSIAAGYAVAWIALVGAAGCAFMTALGARWGYHAVLRTHLRFRD